MQQRPDDAEAHLRNRVDLEDREIDMPMTAGLWKVVPYVAGTYGYDDHEGFMRDLDNDPAGPDDTVMLGEVGVRLSTRMPE